MNSLTVYFDRAVVPSAGAFVLTQGGMAVSGVTVAAANPAGDGKTWVLTFSGSAVVGGSLPDGNYDLAVVASAVHAGTATGPAMAADSHFAFHRRYGDADGDGDTDSLDLFKFRSTLNKRSTDPAYLWYLDYEGNGIVDAVDLFQVRARLGSA